jgi:hypothetical protein
MGYGQALDGKKNASQTRGLSKDGSEVEPHRQEVFYWMHEKHKLDTTLHKGNEMVEWSETSLIDNGSKCFFQELFRLFSLFSGTFYEFFWSFLIFLNFFVFLWDYINTVQELQNSSIEPLEMLDIYKLREWISL